MNPVPSPESTQTALIPEPVKRSQTNSSQSSHSTPETHSNSKLNVHSALFGAVSGMAGRLGTNNLTMMTAHYQSGQFRPDFKFRTLTNLLIGSNLQVAATYGLKSALKCDESPVGSAESVGKYFTAGAVGGLFMHPSFVGFLMSDHPDINKHMSPSPMTPSPRSAPSMRIAIPEINGILKLIREKPQWLLRGSSTRFFLSGFDWASYFTLRDILFQKSDKSDNSRGRADTIAAVISTLITTPIYQAYIKEIKGESNAIILETLRSPPKQAISSLLNSLNPKQLAKGMTPRLAIANIAFNGIATLERLIVDNSERMLEERFSKRADKSDSRI